MKTFIKLFMCAVLAIVMGILYVVSEPSQLKTSAKGATITFTEEPLVVVEKKQKKPEITKPTKKELPELLRNSLPAEELRWLFRVTMSEASTLPFEGKVKVVITVLDRVDDPDYPDNIIDVILQENQFSVADNGRPNKDCMEAVKYAINHRDEYPKDMLWFSSDMTHSYGYYYCSEGNMNFNTKTDYFK